ncbi:MAG: hypothetical protein KAR20_22300, partial [Candidatus Heimdallarchaeota archaeon]|nr:hypothetical protein [Candidatus Heimdallarchaeota archaeon]
MKLIANNTSADFTKVLILFLMFSFLLSIDHVHAGEDINIYADHLEHISEENVFIATGSVKITMDETTLRGDRIRYDRNTDIAVASGNVIFEDNDAV